VSGADSAVCSRWGGCWVGVVYGNVVLGVVVVWGGGGSCGGSSVGGWGW